jgi:hypothetical protein
VHVHHRVRQPLHPRHRSRRAFLPRLLGFDEIFRTPTVGTPEHVELILNGFGVGLGTVEAAKRVHGNALLQDPDGNLVEIVARVA